MNLENQSQEPFNPYAAPGAALDQGAFDEARETRRAHLDHEAAFRSLGIFGWITAAIFLAVGLNDFFGKGVTDPDPMRGILVLLFVALLLIVVPALMGWLYWRLYPLARVFTTLLLLPLLFVFPVGTFLAIVFLVILFTGKSNLVWSSAYQEVLARTPEIRPYGRIAAFFLFWSTAFMIVFGFLGSLS